MARHRVLMEESERFEARRCATSVSRGMSGGAIEGVGDKLFCEAEEWLEADIVYAAGLITGSGTTRRPSGDEVFWL